MEIKDENKATIKKRLKWLRKSTGMTQEAFAKENYISLKTWANYEREKSESLPDRNFLEQLASKYDLPFSYVYGELLDWCTGNNLCCRFGIKFWELYDFISKEDADSILYYSDLLFKLEPLNESFFSSPAFSHLDEYKSGDVIYVEGHRYSLKELEIDHLNFFDRDWYEEDRKIGIRQIIMAIERRLSDIVEGKYGIDFYRPKDTLSLDELYGTDEHNHLVLEKFTKLNAQGKYEAIKRLDEMTMLEQYTRKGGKS